MATVVKYKEHTGWTSRAEIVEIEYDFAKDAGAVGALDLLKVKEGTIVKWCGAKVKTACTSGGLATVSVGISGDAAGLIASTAVASLTADAAIDSASFGSTYKLASDAIIQMTIGTAALTAGKIVFCFELLKF